MNEEVSFEPPKELNFKNIIYWSPSLKNLEGCKGETAIKTKARKLIELGLVSYDNKCFKVKPIPGYNKTTYTVNNRGDGHFQCDCQFYNTVSKHWEHPTCSHIQSVKFWLEIRRWNKLNDGGNTNEDY